MLPQIQEVYILIYYITCDYDKLTMIRQYSEQDVIQKSKFLKSFLYSYKQTFFKVGTQH